MNHEHSYHDRGLIYVLRHYHATITAVVKMSAFSLKVKVQMFGLITVNNILLRQLIVAYVNVEIIQSQNTNVKLVVTQTLGITVVSSETHEVEFGLGNMSEILWF